MLINKLNWIKKIQVQSSKHASNNIGQNLSRKVAAAKRIFMSYVNLSKKSEQIQPYRGWKVAVTIKISDHSELHNKNEISNCAQTCAGMKSPHAK